jgi:hypothetical protein
MFDEDLPEDPNVDCPCEFPLNLSCLTPIMSNSHHVSLSLMDMEKNCKQCDMTSDQILWPCCHALLTLVHQYKFG